MLESNQKSEVEINSVSVIWQGLNAPESRVIRAFTEAELTPVDIEPVRARRIREFDLSGNSSLRLVGWGPDDVEGFEVVNIGPSLLDSRLSFEPVLPDRQSQLISLAVGSVPFTKLFGTMVVQTRAAFETALNQDEPIGLEDVPDFDGLMHREFQLRAEAHSGLKVVSGPQALKQALTGDNIRPGPEFHETLWQALLEAYMPAVYYAAALRPLDSHILDMLVSAEREAEASQPSEETEQSEPSSPAPEID